MGTVFVKILEMSITASFLMLVVILLRFPLKKAPKWFMGVLWAIVALKLIMPFQVESQLGIFPDINGAVESLLLGDNNDVEKVEVTYHEYNPASEIGAAAVGGENMMAPAGSDGVVYDYLPNEQIITETTHSGVLETLSYRSGLVAWLWKVWIVGILGVLIYAIAGFISIKKEISISIRRDEMPDERGKKAVSAGNAKSTYNVFVCDGIDTPFILGFIRPAIYLPSGLDKETEGNVLLHERAHIARYDHIRKLIGFILLGVHWFNPLVWVSFTLFCKDIELSCDERVIKDMSLEEKKSYATSLLNCSTHRRDALTYSLAFGEVGVKTRIKQIFNYRKPSFWLITMLIAVSVALYGCFFTSASGGEKKGDDYSELAPYDELLSDWYTAFEDRDADFIVSHSNEKAMQNLMDEELLFFDADGSISFGYSSPWPSMFGSEEIPNRTIIVTDDYTKAEVHYYAADSEPHVYVWQETLKFAKDREGVVMVDSEELNFCDNIESVKDFEKAYVEHPEDFDAVDYTKNGLGEILNGIAKQDTNGYYSKLFDPCTAARYLLNLSDDTSKVKVKVQEETEQGDVINITFPDGGYYGRYMLVQPWGSDGIYVPVIADGHNYIAVDDELMNQPIEDADGELTTLPYVEGSEDTNNNEETEHIIVDADETNYDAIDETEIGLPYLNYVFEDIVVPQSGDILYETADLDGDGKLERVEEKELGYQGGDGGSEIRVYDEAGEEIPLPEFVNKNSFYAEWNAEGVRIMRDDVLVAELTKEQVQKLYVLKGWYTKDELSKTEAFFKNSEIIEGDFPSGFAIENNGKFTELIIKYYIQGKEGHSDKLGYVLEHLILGADHTWSERAEFVIDP